MMDCDCGAATKFKCSGCGVMPYCSVECQRKDWRNHKSECLKIKNLPVRSCKVVRIATVFECRDEQLKQLSEDYLVARNLCPAIVNCGGEMFVSVRPNKMGITDDCIMTVKKKYLKRLPSVVDWVKQYLFLGPADRYAVTVVDESLWWYRAAIMCSELGMKALSPEMVLVVCQIVKQGFNGDFDDAFCAMEAAIDSWNNAADLKEAAKLRVRTFIRRYWAGKEL
jgi:hypothetical protein